MIIGINGPKRSGKDTAYLILRKLLYPRVVYRLGFADELKVHVARMLGISLKEIEDNKQRFRLIMQGYGTDYCRDKFGDDYWINIWKKGVALLENDLGNPFIITPDVRFENERDAIIDMGGAVISISPVNRSNIVPDAHASETYPILGALTFINDFTNPNILYNSLKEFSLKYTKNENT